MVSKGTDLEAAMEHSAVGGARLVPGVSNLTFLRAHDVELLETVSHQTSFNKFLFFLPKLNSVTFNKEFHQMLLLKMT